MVSSATPLYKEYHPQTEEKIPKYPPALVTCSFAVKVPIVNIRKVNSRKNSKRNKPHVDFKVHINIKNVNTVQPAKKNPMALLNIFGSSAYDDTIWNWSVKMQPYEIQKPPNAPKTVIPYVFPLG